MVSSHRSMLPDENLKINISKSIQVRILRPCLFPPSFPFSCHLPSPNPLLTPSFYPETHRAQCPGVKHEGNLSSLSWQHTGTNHIGYGTCYEPHLHFLEPVNPLLYPIDHSEAPTDPLYCPPQATPALKTARENLFSRSC